jgi:peptide/nickel transport system permease protein
MQRYLLRRLAISVIVLVGITVFTYLFVNLAPGDPVTAMIDPEQMATLGPGWVAEQRKSLGLDAPLPVRYVLWLKATAQGNLGFSYSDRQPVTAKILARIWPTVKLMLTAELLSLALAIPIGIVSALKQYSVLDYLTTIFGFFALSIPSFFLALGGIYIFGVRFGWLPTAGMTTVGQSGSLWDSLHHLILPASVLGLSHVASLIRYTRSSMLETLRQDYVVVARAKGLRERTVIWRHALRNALIPLVTVIALDLPRLFGGTVIIEQIFAWPGMGTLAITAVIGRDYPVIMAINLISALLIVLSNLLADIVYAGLDPRIKYA